MLFPFEVWVSFGFALHIRNATLARALIVVVLCNFLFFCGWRILNTEGERLSCERKALHSLPIVSQQYKCGRWSSTDFPSLLQCDPHQLQAISLSVPEAFPHRLLKQKLASQTVHADLKVCAACSYLFPRLNIKNKIDIMEAVLLGWKKNHVKFKMSKN